VLDGISSLLDKSLLQQDELAGQSRFAMLQTIREYALERLESSGEAPAIRQRQAEYFLELVTRGGTGRVYGRSAHLAALVGG